MKQDRFFKLGRYAIHLLAGATLSLALSGQSAVARELWVDHDSKGGACSDARAAGSVAQTTPWCTLGAAANKVAPGDLVRGRGATYTEAHNCPTCDGTAALQLITAGSAGQWIRFVAEPNETAILQGGTGVVSGLQIKAVGGTLPSFNEISGFHIRNMSKNCVALNNVPDIRLINIEATGCGSGAVELHNAQRVTLEGSQIHDNNTSGWTSAIDLYLCKDGNVIRGNRVWSNSDNSPGNPDTEGHGMMMDYCEASGGALIENNVFWNNEGWCIAIYHSDGATLRNNTCYQNGVRLGGGEISVLGNRANIYNNVLVPRLGQWALSMRYNNSSYSIDTATLQENFNLIGAQAAAVSVAWGDSTGTLAQYQLGNPRGWGASTRAADPLFSNALTKDFHLLAASPARDTGDNLHAAAIDAENRARPYGPTVDRGAYEYAPAGTPTPLAPPTNLRVLSTTP